MPAAEAFLSAPLGVPVVPDVWMTTLGDATVARERRWWQRALFPDPFLIRDRIGQSVFLRSHVNESDALVRALLDLFRVLRVVEEQRGVGRLDGVLELLRLRPRVQGASDDAELLGAERDLDHLPAVAQQQGHAVVAAEAFLFESASDLIRPSVELLPALGPVPVEDRGLVSENDGVHLAQDPERRASTDQPGERRGDAQRPLDVDGSRIP